MFKKEGRYSHYFPSVVFWKAERRLVPLHKDTELDLCMQLFQTLSTITDNILLFSLHLQCPIVKYFILVLQWH